MNEYRDWVFCRNIGFRYNNRLALSFCLKRNTKHCASTFFFLVSRKPEVMHLRNINLVLLRHNVTLFNVCRDLYLNKGDEEGALKVLQYLRGVSDISNEIRSLKEEAEMNEGIEILGLFEVRFISCHT